MFSCYELSWDNPIGDIAHGYEAEKVLHLVTVIKTPDGHPKCSTCGQSNCSTWPPAFEVLNSPARH
jgi:hypothetical protein